MLDTDLDMENQDGNFVECWECMVLSRGNVMEKQKMGHVWVKYNFEFLENGTLLD